MQYLDPGSVFVKTIGWSVLVQLTLLHDTKHYNITLSGKQGRAKYLASYWNLENFPKRKGSDEV